MPSIYDLLGTRIRLAGRATHQAQATIAPQQRQVDRAIQRIRRQTGRQVGRIHRQAGRAEHSAIATTNRQANYEQSLANDLSGLGPYKGQVAHQLQAGADQVQNYGQGLARLAQRASAQDIHAANQQARNAIYSQRSQVPSVKSVASANFTKLMTAHNQAMRQAQQAQGQAQRQKLHDAVQAASNLITHAHTLPDGTVVPAGAAPTTDAGWLTLRNEVQRENPTLAPALVDRAVAELRARYAINQTLPSNVAGPTLRETDPRFQQQIRDQYTQYFLSQFGR